MNTLRPTNIVDSKVLYQWSTTPLTHPEESYAYYEDMHERLYREATTADEQFNYWDDYDREFNVTY